MNSLRINSRFYLEDVVSFDPSIISDGIEIDLTDLTEWDQTAIFFFRYLSAHEAVRLKNVPQRLLKQMDKSQHQSKSRQISKEKMKSRREQTGEIVLGFISKLRTYFMLLADEIFHLFSFFRKRKGVYSGEISKQFFLMGYGSFPIVSVISFLVGVTISITTIQQLQNFGADIYLADIVGYGLIRELIPLMTGIILAGKIGASVTAEIASMMVLEEVDALKTMGIVPEKFLMVPRILGICLSIPLLIAVADAVGIIGGILVGKIIAGIPITVFYNEMLTVVGVGDFLIGMGKALIFGIVIIISSGYKGFGVRRGAEEVGRATTESVVLSISLIIVIDCIFALILY